MEKPFCKMCENLREAAKCGSWFEVGILKSRGFILGFAENRKKV